MLKVTDACEYHRQIVIITISNAQLILDGPTRLNDRLDSSFVCYLDTVWKWEKSIRCHNSSLSAKSKFLGLSYGLVAGIDTRSLATAHTEQLIVLGDHDRIGLQMFGQFVGKKEVLDLVLRWGGLGDDLKVSGSLGIQVGILSDDAIEYTLKAGFISI